MEKFPRSLANKLQQRSLQNAFRVLPSADGLVDFSSNDYLGFSSSRQIFHDAHAYLKDRGIIQNGATGSRLISGNHKLYREAELFIAGFHKTESALIFNSGYDANVGFFSSVPQKGDVILYDEYIHASIRDGMRLSNAGAHKFAHNNTESLSAQLKKLQGKAEGQEIYIVTESVFSMDGDSPDLAAMVQMADGYGAHLVVDEAHALGVIGNSGEGLVQSLGLQDKMFARIVTFGKGLGCHGAAILCSQQLVDYLVNFSRSFIYTTALPPHSLATLLSAYRHLTDATRRMALQENINFFIGKAHSLGLQEFIPSSSAIHCIVIPGVSKVKTIAAGLQDGGYGVKAILSPTVPQGSERLRFCLHSFNTQGEISGALQRLTLHLQ